jgi:3'(2'),5'-bisphosphate nucleotidase
MKTEVIDIIRKAGERVLEIYNSDFETEYKDDKSPLTLADLESEIILVEGLKKFNFGIVTEESKFSGNKEKFWVIDPLDGTKDFIQKTDEFSIMVALVENNIPILGFVYAPALDKLYYAEKGKGSFLIEKGIEKKLNVNSINETKKLKMVISRNHFRQEDKDIALKLGVTDFISKGSVGVKYGFIAEGKADLCIYTTNFLGIWDSAAPHIILKEANGLIFDIFGNEPKYFCDKLKMDNGFIGSVGFKEEILESIPQKKGFVLWFTGLSGSGKSTISESISKELKKRNVSFELFDGDEVREHLTKDLGFSKEDRDENIRRISYVSKLLSRNNIGVVTAFISPYQKMRDYARNSVNNFIEVFVNSPLNICERRDVKGLYKKARKGEIKMFTGISDPYEEPINPEIILNTHEETIEESTNKIISYLKKRGLI